MSHKRLSWSFAIIAAVAVVLCILGWQLYQFITDDAYIAFRYISNRQLGCGYTWNAPPFRPVEGYTSFLWLVLLDAVWTFTGVLPPQAVNSITLGFSILSLLITLVMMYRICREHVLQQPQAATGKMILAVSCAVFWLVTNRTFLMWTSSGLETALFNFLVLSWIYTGFFMVYKVYQMGKSHSDSSSMNSKPLTPFPLFLLSLIAALLYLTRPDGLVFAFFTLITVAAVSSVLRNPGIPANSRISSSFIKRLLFMLLPLVIIPAHLLWRKSTYGEWLPNSYYAKYSAPWPQAGIRYLLSFILEYFLWIWLFVLLAAAIKLIIHRWKNKTTTRLETGHSNKLSLLFSWLVSPRSIPWWLGAAVFVQLGYYTFIIGGDHFEYRIYSYLVPLIAVTFVWAVLTLRISARSTFFLFFIFILFSVQIPWIHWGISQAKETRRETYKMTLPVAPHSAPPLRPYVRVFDNLQAWLIDRYICMRHQEHKMLTRYLESFLPTREEAKKFPPGNTPNPVVLSHCAGLPGWVFPRMHVIDYFGINDYIIARSPMETGKKREMAHDRKPPPGYIESFRPDLVVFMEGVVEYFEKDTPLTDDDIRQIENKFSSRLKH